MGSWAVPHLPPCGLSTSRSLGLPPASASPPLSFLQDLGITKVGHMKRILQAIKELSNLP